ncbi:MAG TPA: pentapeptide repeat-containing protein, partial [Nitrospira sp.]|nr:pentapeptide repeat-containing protein [Nitrospira sp.]
MSTPRRSVKMNRPVRLLALALGVLVGIAGLCWAETPAPSTSRTASCTSPYKKKAVPTKALRAIVQSHRQWLEERYNPNSHRADLCMADLHRAALNGADLERANLEGANLQHA